MTLKKRSLMLAVLLTFASIAYGTARYYSPMLIHHVVKQSLIQKAPPGITSTMAQQRLQAYLSTAPNQQIYLQRLLHISTCLEKAQHLTLKEWDGLYMGKNSGSIEP
jgi:hypothetical protein